MAIQDLSLLPAPDVIEALDYEAALATLAADLVARHPASADVIGLESEPLRKLLEAIAYSKINDRARVNDAAHAVMLAYAVGPDLDQIGANVETPRLAGEADARYRQRIQQAFHRYAAAGPANAYRQHALGVSIDIIDVDVWSAQPGQVTVAVLARELLDPAAVADADLAIGAALFGAAPASDSAWCLAPTSGALLRQVLVALNADDVRPLTDAVIVRAPDVITFTIDAVIEILPGPDPELIRGRRLLAVAAYLAGVRRIGYDVTRAGIIAALVEAGVKNVRLASPAADIVCLHGDLAACLSVTVSSEVVDV